ncbi:MAG TPA: hypothetical protein VFA82_02025 [Gaiellaceae bacterium]|nr:hypothetical protein [Gaiellaceae bacterium]
MHSTPERLRLYRRLDLPLISLVVWYLAVWAAVAYGLDLLLS